MEKDPTTGSFKFRRAVVSSNENKVLTYLDSFIAFLVSDTYTREEGATILYNARNAGERDFLLNDFQKRGRFDCGDRGQVN